MAASAGRSVRRVSGVTGRSVGSLPTLALLGVTAAWGSTFFMTKNLLEQITVLDFLSIRFAIAAVALFVVAPRAVGRLSRDELRQGAVLGAVYGSAQVLQTVGLERTTASVTGFVTGMYVVLTPLLSASLLREQIDRLVWVAVAMSTVGLAFLSLNGLAVSSGVVLVFVSTIGYAVHIIGLARWSSTSNVLGLSIVQLTVSCLVATVVSAPNGIHPPITSGGWVALVYMAVIPGSLAILGQTWAQAHLTSTRAAIIMTTEPVFAAFFAVLFGGESLTGRMLIGGAFVLAAMYLVELTPRRRVEGEVSHLAV
jgi:drug/metabolite transporter (DMT)-like permease